MALLSVIKRVLLLMVFSNSMVMTETFAPVAHRTTIHTYIVVASVPWWAISQLDVKNVFLGGELMRSSTCTNLLATLFLRAMFVVSAVLSMASNKPLVLGLSISPRLSLFLDL
jgi:hypothetical protein